MPLPQGPLRLYNKFRSRFRFSSQTPSSSAGISSGGDDQEQAVSSRDPVQGSSSQLEPNSLVNKDVNAQQSIPFSKLMKLQVPFEESKPVLRVAVVVDGNAAIFSRDYVLDEDGAVCGGMRATNKLEDIVAELIRKTPDTHIQYWIHVRLDKRKVAEAMAIEWNVDRERMRRKLDAFIAGVNNTTHRVQMMDSYIHDDGAGYLQFDYMIEDELRLPQTKHVVFVGCRKEGYVDLLQTQIKNGLGEKLILLQTYDELAPGYAELGLPIQIDSSDLFVKRPLKEIKSDALSMLSSRASDDYHSPRTKEASVSEAGSDTLAHFPCPVYYLSDSGCEKEDDCLYTHDYPLGARQLSELAAQAKLKPCTRLVQGQPCPNVRRCIWGHKCPFDGQCRFLKSKCWFCDADTLPPKEVPSGPSVEPEDDKTRNFESAATPNEELEPPMTPDGSADTNVNDKTLSDDSDTMHEGSNEDIGKDKERIL